MVVAVQGASAFLGYGAHSYFQADGSTALHFSVRRKDLESVAELISLKAEVNAGDLVRDTVWR